MDNGQFKLTKIGVIMLGTKDLARSAAFYRDTLGLAVKFEIPQEFVFLEAGGLMLVLSTLHAQTSAPLVGATEIVFAVEDVRAAYEALRARGVNFTQAPRNVSGSNWAANFNDPDGHRLSVFGPERKA